MPNTINNLKHHEKLNKKKIYLINIISFFFGFGLALTSFLYSFYFEEATGDSNVSNFYLATHVIFLIIILNLHKVIKSIGKSMALYLFLFFKLLAILLVLFLDISLLGSLSIIAYITFGNLAWVNLNIILESYSTDKMSGRIRGIFMTIVNTGFIFGPFLSMQLLGKYDFKGVFIVVLVIDALILLLSIFSFNNLKHTYKESFTVGNLIKKAKKRKNVMRIYYISYVLQFFYATMIMYMPLHLRSIGFEFSEIGIIFTVMLLPFVIFQYPVGILADKKMGEKELIIFALMVMALSTLSIFYIESTSIFVWAVILFATRIGASFIEILRDSYFFKRIDGNDVELIDFFKTAKPTAYITFSLISGVLLSFLEINTMFLLLTIVIISGLYPAFKLKDNLGEEELKKLNS
ncbi:MFS transporter [Candidatus Parcubacteria bacterium]|nr:MFS transporter [Candidatus Parcubacteria bacterium]